MANPASVRFRLVRQEHPKILPVPRPEISTIAPLREGWAPRDSKRVQEAVSDGCSERNEEHDDHVAQWSIFNFTQRSAQREYLHVHICSSKRYLNSLHVIINQFVSALNRRACWLPGAWLFAGGAESQRLRATWDGETALDPG